MKQIGKLVFIGTFGGAVLASLLLLIYLLTNNQAYVLLFNTDYIPLLKHLPSTSVVGITFHFSFCIVSVLLLFYVLKWFHREHQMILYMLIYSGGSAVLFFLTIFTEKPPLTTDMLAWFYWTLAHTVYAVIVGYLVKKWV